MSNNPRYCVGIDPGAITGLAVYDRHEKKLVRVESSTFWDCYDYLFASLPTDFHVRVEVPKTKAQFGGGKSSHTRSVNVGMVYGQSVVLADGIERLGFSVDRVHPTGKGKKLTNNQIQAITGWSNGTNEHTRDAIMLCYGR